MSALILVQGSTNGVAKLMALRAVEDIAVNF